MFLIKTSYIRHGIKDFEREITLDVSENSTIYRNYKKMYVYPIHMYILDSLLPVSIRPLVGAVVLNLYPDIREEIEEMNNSGGNR